MWKLHIQNYQNGEFDIVHGESYSSENKGRIFMSIESRDIRKIGILVLLLAFVFVAITLPLLSADPADAVTAVTFTLILTLEILFALSFTSQQLVCTAYPFGIRLRSPPIC